MKTKLSIIALLASALIARSADKPIDLTGSDADSFKKHVGSVITLRGQLEQGKQGLCLVGATATNVVFYVIPEVRPGSGYTYPAAWERLMHQRVRVTGELKLRSSGRAKEDPLTQNSPDYYYLVLQRTRIESLETK